MRIMPFSAIAAAALALIAACTGAGPGADPANTAAPDAPSNFAVNGMSSVCVELRWDDNSDDEANFIVQRATDAGFTAGLVETSLEAGAVRYRDYDGVVPRARCLLPTSKSRRAICTSPTATPPTAARYYPA